MDYEFLRDFPKRMHTVGRYALLMQNSSGKTTWKQYDITSLDEQINILYSILLFIMESSLKEINCTMDDISNYLGSISDIYFGKNYSLDEVKDLADFIVNSVFCNGGNMMSFKGFDYEKKAYKEYNIRFVKNEIVYLDHNIRRTSYSLTEEGYNMVLASLEIENNLKISVHEMLFKMHLEKADYNSASQDMKNIFDQLRMQYQKIQEAMNRIRKNALSYSVEEYDRLIHENIDTLEDSRNKFKGHRENIQKRVAEFEAEAMEKEDFNEKDRQNMDRLKEIDSYLQKSLEEQQRILGEHFDLKSLYDVELLNYSNMTMVQRFSFDNEVYERVLDDANLLRNTGDILAPLLFQNPEKRYNPNLALEYQKRLRKMSEEEELVELDFDEEAYQKEQIEKKRQSYGVYKKCVEIFLQAIWERKDTSLRQMQEIEYKKYGTDFVPGLEIFREIVIEFLSAEEISFEELKKEREDFFIEESYDFELKQMIMEIVEEQKLTGINKIRCQRMEEEHSVILEDVMDEHGDLRILKCSNLRFWCE